MNLQTAEMLLQAATVLYLGGMAGYFLFLFLQKEFYQKAAFGLICVALVCHLGHLIIYTNVAGHFPIQNLEQSLSVSAFSIGGMFLYLKYKSNLKILGVFTSTILSVMMVAVWFIPDTQVESNTILKGFWFYAHIVMVFAGNAALALACGAGILYLLQEKGIKSKHPGFFFKRLPSLDFLDSVGYTCLSTGFAFLTIGLVTGFIYAKSIWGKFWSWDPKELFSIGTWLIYAILLHLRYHSGWRGRNSAIMTIVGFVIIVFTFLGVNLLLGGHHQDFTR